MNIEVSLPEDLLRAADTLANGIGISRSELIAVALAEWLAKHDQDEVTARLNRIYATEESGLDPLLRRAQGESIGADDLLEVARPLDFQELESTRRRSKLDRDDAASCRDEVNESVRECRARLEAACAMVDPAEERALAEGRGEHVRR